jgi:hypothetical protein
MARISDARPRGLIGRMIFWFTRRKVGKIVGPMRVTAHHKQLLVGTGFMERAQAGATRVPGALKTLAAIRTSTLVGCPF